MEIDWEQHLQAALNRDQEEEPCLQQTPTNRFDLALPDEGMDIEIPRIPES